MAIYLKRSKENQIAVIFDYSVSRLQKIRRIEGRKWNREAKEWIIPISKETLIHCMTIFQDEEIIPDFYVAEMIKKVWNYSSTNIF